MSNREFQAQVQQYFESRGTHPVTLTFKNKQVDDKFLVDLDKTINKRFGNRDDITLIDTRIIEGEYWSGVLIEFDETEFDGVDSTDFSAMHSNETLNGQLLTLYDEFAEFDTRITGFSTGSSVYAVSSLRSLNESYFRTATDIYNGPSNP